MSGPCPRPQSTPLASFLFASQTRTRSYKPASSFPVLFRRGPRNLPALSRLRGTVWARRDPPSLPAPRSLDGFRCGAQCGQHVALQAGALGAHAIPWHTSSTDRNQMPGTPVFAWK